jgi:hypothetical protein
MLASLLLAAATALLAPVPAPAPTAVPPEQTVPIERKHAPLPSGSTQPLTTTPRPSIGFLSADALRDRCQSNAAGLVSYCFAYITGVHDTVQAYETWLRVREFCPPYTSSQSDMRRAFLSYLANNPGAASGEAASVIVLAFKDQFACSKPEEAKAPASTAPTQTTKPARKR